MGNIHVDDYYVSADSAAARNWIGQFRQPLTEKVMLFQVWREVKVNGVSYSISEYEAYDPVAALRELECIPEYANAYVRVLPEYEGPAVTLDRPSMVINMKWAALIAAHVSIFWDHRDPADYWHPVLGVPEFEKIKSETEQTTGRKGWWPEWAADPAIKVTRRHVQELILDATKSALWGKNATFGTSLVDDPFGSSEPPALLWASAIKRSYSCVLNRWREIAISMMMAVYFPPPDDGDYDGDGDDGDYDGDGDDGDYDGDYDYWDSPVPVGNEGELA